MLITYLHGRTLTLTHNKLVIQGFNKGSQRAITMIFLELTIGDLKASEFVMS